MTALRLALLLGLFLPAAPDATGQERLEFLLEEAAGDLLLRADTLCEEGYLGQAKRALDKSESIVSESPGADAVRDAIRTRRAAFPRPADPIDTKQHARPLYNGKTLAGWRKSRGAWEATGPGVRCDAEKSEGYLLLSRADKECRGYTLTFTFERDQEGSAGAVLGLSGRNRVGVTFSDEGAALYDFTASRALSDWTRRKFPHRRALSVDLRIEQGRVILSMGGKPVLQGTLTGWEPGTVGFHASVGALFRNPRMIPLEIDLCIDQAVKCSKKGDHEAAASFLQRALAVDATDVLSAGALAAELDKLEFRDAAAEQAGMFLASCGPQPRRSDLKRMKRSAEEIAARGTEAARELDRCLGHWAGKILAAGEESLASADEEAQPGAAAESLDTVVKALESVDVRQERVEDFRSRVFLARCGDDRGKELFNGQDLSGWTVRTGVWEATEPLEGDPVAPGDGGILTVMGGEGSNQIESGALPAFDRYLIALEMHGTGAYIDQGITFFVKGEPWSVKFFRFMGTQEVKIIRKGTPDLFRHVPGSALTSTKWHDVECIVHVNRLTVLLDKKALFTKVLPAPPENRIGLLVANDRRGHFDEIVYRPLGRHGEYRDLLEGIGVPVLEVTECEALKEGEVVTGGRVHEQPFAYNGHSLTGVFDAKTRSPLTFRLKTLAIDDAVLSLRYAGHHRGNSGAQARSAASSAALCRVHVLLDGRSQPGTLDLTPTASRNDFVYARMPLGDLSFGWHEIRLEAPPTRSALYLDRIAVSSAGHAPREETKIVDSDAAPNFKIRLSPGVRLPDNSEELFALLEVVRSYMVEHYGFAPDVTQYYNVIARECWGDPHKGGYATGDNLYIPEETAARNLAVIMHELSHNFDRGMGFNPPWFGEGKSFPIYVKFTRDTRGRYRAHQDPHSKGDMARGGASFDQLEIGGENLLQYWGTPKFPYWGKLPDGRDVTVLGYQAANWLCWELSLFLGEGWLRSYFDLLRKEIEEKTFYLPKDRIAANSVVVDYFARSSGKDARSFFRDHRFEVIDIYGWSEITADCGDDEEVYLTDAGSSKVEATDGGGSRKKSRLSRDAKSRVISEGSFTYAFPVPPDTEKVTVEITRTGYGTCHIWDKRIFKGKTPTGAETKTVTLDDPAFWASSRLRLTFAPDRFGDRALAVSRIVVKRE